MTGFLCNSCMSIISPQMVIPRCGNNDCQLYTNRLFWHELVEQHDRDTNQLFQNESEAVFEKLGENSSAQTGIMPPLEGFVENPDPVTARCAKHTTLLNLHCPRCTTLLNESIPFRYSLELIPVFFDSNDTADIQ